MIFRSMPLTLSLIFVSFVSGWVGLSFADRDSPTRMLSSEVMGGPVPPGGVLSIRYRVDRYRSCAVRIDRVLYDAQRTRVALEDLDFGSAPGPLGDDTYSVKIDVPRSFAQGPATYQTVARYECNPLHRLWPIVVPGPLIQFEVKGPAVPAQPVTLTQP